MLIIFYYKSIYGFPHFADGDLWSHRTPESSLRGISIIQINFSKFCLRFMIIQIQIMDFRKNLTLLLSFSGRLATWPFLVKKLSQQYISHNLTMSQCISSETIPNDMENLTSCITWIYTYYNLVQKLLV